MGCGPSVRVSGISDDFCGSGAEAAVEGHSAGKVWGSNKKIHLDRKDTDISCINKQTKKKCQTSWRKMTIWFHSFNPPCLISRVFLLGMSLRQREVSRCNIKAELQDISTLTLVQITGSRIISQMIEVISPVCSDRKPNLSSS